MQVWFNGLYKAPLHRVLADRERVRYSAPFFYNPSYQTMVTPVKSAGVAKEGLKATLVTTARTFRSVIG